MEPSIGFEPMREKPPPDYKSGAIDQLSELGIKKGVLPVFNLSRRLRGGRLKCQNGTGEGNRTLVTSVMSTSGQPTAHPGIRQTNSIKIVCWN